MSELYVRGGPILTQDPARPRAAALAVAGGRIVAVGAESEVERFTTAATERIDLAGRTLVPGFIDAHAHVWKIGHLLTSMVDLRKVRSIGELAAALRARATDGDGWLLGRGYNEARLTELHPPTRADLDRAVPERPVAITRTCGHICACNSPALALAGITSGTADPPGGVIVRDASGEPTGLLHETAMGLINRVMPPPTGAEYEAMIDAALGAGLALGITSTTDAGVSPSLLETYRRMDRVGRLRSRVNVMALRRVDGQGDVPLPERHSSDHLRIDTVKFLADGGLSGATAALSIDYRHTSTRGVLRFTDAELDQLAGEAHRAGWRVAIHAIGDVTIEQVLRLYQRLGPGSVRHRIEHLGLPSNAQLALAARLGVIAAPQTIFLWELGANFRAYLPDQLLARAYPIRAMLDAGVTVALSSDAPVVESQDPLAGLKAAVDRRDSHGESLAREQAITPAEALWCYTMGGAIASGDEANRGSLTPGKWADLAVLDGDPLTDWERPPKVTATFLAGRPVYRA